jgi:glycosyltransferase involved in cell wall biosynthesis
MRILVAADEYPWPARSGYRQRLHWLLRTLSASGAVDLLITRPQPTAGLPEPPLDVRLADLRVVATGRLPLPAGSRARRWLVGPLPRKLVGRDWSAARDVAREWADRGYDVVWFSHSPLYLGLRDVLPEPHVVDLDNLESSLLHHRGRSGRWPRSATVGGLAADLKRVPADLLDEIRWRRLERLIARTATVTVVCSELDRRRLGEPRVSVVPNGYELPTGRSGGPPGGDVGPVLLMVGLLTYEPNRDAVAFFARQVLPLIRARIPDARLRVVGRYGAEGIQRLRGLPGVEFAGEVPDVGPELAAARVSVVPIRFGGGTRIKILEAFAHGVPVVSTTVGCEGLDVIDGRHLLVADRPAELAVACCRLLTDEDVRKRISAEARALWEQRYRWTAVTPAVAEVLEEATTQGT